MGVAEFDTLWEMALEFSSTARHIADHVIQLSEGVVKKYAKARTISKLPTIAGMDIGHGMKAWAAILSVDMVGSSNRAVRIGARDTYITMHTYLPLMAEIASKRGHVVGLRGDGLFAAYGLTELTGTNVEVDTDLADKAVGNAAKTGKAMIEAAEEIISPVLERLKIEGDVRVRVGVDVGPIVVTRIGIDDAQEVTAYGPAVNNACKMRNNRSVTISHRANLFYKGKPGGKIIRRRSGHDWRLDFGSLQMLNR